MKPSARTLVAGLLLVAVALIAYRFYASPERTVRARAVDRRVIALRILGEHLAGTLPGGKVLVVGNPFSQLPNQPAEVQAFETAAVKGLEAGAAGRMTILGTAYPALTPAARQDPSSVPLPPDASTPLSFMTEEGSWDTLLRNRPGTEILVSLIGLPAGLTQIEAWRQATPRWALLLPDLRLLGDPESVRTAFRSGKILGAVLNRPGAPAELKGIESDPHREFERRFLLVTATNIDTVLQQYPGLF
ncbi:MAG TPA: hypothetical protein PKM73_06390 [Verrucomicrobiota bacterium]|nr:hypothetical protein [Verrucomicrobiota bacterium]HNU51146.1 hypothetical protein [Verrucomicrobiota bacterium]